MRFIARVYQTSTTAFHVPFTVPCAGYFNNISIVMRMSTTVDHWHVAIGKTNPNNFQNQFTPTAGTWAKVKGKSSANLARWDWSDVVPEQGDVNPEYKVYHGYRNKRLYLKSDELYTISFDAGTTTGVILVIQADFVPYNNAHFKYTYTLNSIAADSDHNQGLMIPQALKGATLRIFGHVDTATGEHGTLQFRIADRDDPDFDSADYLTGTGVVDTSTGAVVGDTFASMGIYEVMVGQPNNQGGSNQIDTIFAIRKIIHEGDAITYDAIQDAATFTAGDIDLRIELEGKVFQKNKSSFRSHFVEGVRVMQIIGSGGTRQ